MFPKLEDGTFISTTNQIVSNVNSDSRYPVTQCAIEIDEWNKRNPGSTPVAYIDFEGFYSDEISIKDTGSRVYAKNTDLYLVSVRTTTGIDYVGDPLHFDWSLINGMVWVAHNMSFDYWPTTYTIDRWRYARKQNGLLYHKPEPSEWNCTANLCASLFNVRSLRESCLCTLGYECSKVLRDEMKGVNYRTLPLHKQEEIKQYCRNDSALGLILWLRYSEKWLLLDRKLSEHTIIAPARGVCVDTEKLHAGMDKLTHILKNYEQAIPWRKYDTTARTPDNPKGQFLNSKGKLAPVRSSTHIKAYCDSHNIPCPKSLAATDPECNAWLEKYGELHPVLKSIQRYGSVNTILQKHYSLESMLDYDEQANAPVFTPSLLFYGAHTGRWSGGMYDGDGVAFNIQNLARVPLKEDDSIYMRSYLVPRSGHKFFIPDLSQIEPRVLYYLAGDFKMLNKCRETSIYQAFAELFLGYVPSEPGEKLKKANPELYQLTKCMVLGLGFGLGNPEKFVNYCATTYGVTISLNKAREAIAKYRHTNPRVVTLWNNLGSEIHKAWNGDPKKHLEQELPSGRSLNYYLTSANTTHQGLKRTARVHRIYGAKLVENIVQATARDVFGNCLLNLEREGFPVLFHAHDEAIIEYPDKGDIENKRTMERITDIMRIPPDFFPLIPLDSECVISDHYCK
jgi:hypothetical protein